MLSLTTHDFFSVFSLIFLGFSSCFFLSFFSFIFNSSFFLPQFNLRFFFVIKAYSFYVSLFILAFIFLIEVNTPVDSFISFWGFFSSSYFSHCITLIIIILSILSLIGSQPYFQKIHFFSFEYFFLFLLAVFSLAGLPCCFDFIGVYLFLELQSLIFYTLASFNRTSSFSTEAGVKYFIMGAFSSGLLLFGMSLIYGACGTLNFEVLRILLFDSVYLNNHYNIILCYFGLFLIFSSFCFKISAAPFHFWSPEVYEGSPSPVSFFFAVVPKLSLFSALLHICSFVFFEFSYFWEVLFVTIAFFSLSFGSFSAVGQKKTKKFLALSSVTHVGFIIAAASTHSFDGMTSVFFYLFVYSFLSVSFWSFVTFLNAQPFFKQSAFLIDFFLVNQQNFMLGSSLCLVLFSMAGIPPLSGFGAKFFSFISVLENGSSFLSFFIVLFAVISCFYYLRIVKWIFFDASKAKSLYKSKPFFSMSLFESFTFTCGLFFSCFLFIVPDFFILVSHRIVLALF